MAAEVKPRRLPPWTVEEHPIHSSSATQPGWLTPISIFARARASSFRTCSPTLAANFAKLPTKKTPQ